MEQQKRIAQVCKHSWAGFLAYDVEVVGETAHYYRVKALQTFTLPSRRHLAVGALREMGAKVVAELRPGGNGCIDSVGHPLTCKCPYGPGVP